MLGCEIKGVQFQREDKIFRQPPSNAGSNTASILGANFDSQSQTTALSSQKVYQALSKKPPIAAGGSANSASNTPGDQKKVTDAELYIS